MTKKRKPTPGIALPALAGSLRICFRYDPPRGEREGRARVSKMVARFYDCSRQRAQQIVSRMERHGYMYRLKKGRTLRWHFAPFPGRQG